METPIFEESQEIPLRGPLAFMSGAAFFVIPLFTTMPLPLILLMFACGIGMSTFIGAFMRMHTLVTSAVLSFGPKLWTRRIPISEIEVIGPEQIPLLAGVGIHKFRGKIYYNMRLGEGLAIRTGKRHYVVGSARIQQLQLALETARRESAR
ncbi:hypothetical protein KJZ99_09515 [bacterium]|nr:hypothetical protein [bacterium]